MKLVRSRVICFIMYAVFVHLSFAQEYDSNSYSIVETDEELEQSSSFDDSYYLCNDPFFSRAPESSHPRDCSDVQSSSPSRLTSGIYEIQPFGSSSSFHVYCDFDTDGGGWTVFQRRVNGSVDFGRGWDDYKCGFGSLRSEFWLGNEKIALLTAQRKYELRIELTGKEDYPRHAKYAYFRLGDESTNYRLFVGSYTGIAGQDSLEAHRNMMFATDDADYNQADENCTFSHTGGWWFNNCDTSNLNGIYGVDFDSGIRWTGHPGGNYGLKFTEMKIKAL